MSDIKMYVFNIGTIAVSMSQIDMILKITLLVISVGYTAHKWYILYKNSKKTDD